MKRIAALAIVFCAASFGTPLIGSGSLTPFGSNPTNNNTPFWDQPSTDNATCNVGYFLAGGFSPCNNMQLGTPATGLNLGAANLSYYSNADAVTSFYVAAGKYTFGLEGSVAGSGDHIFGYRLKSGGPDVDVFSSHTDIVGATVVLTFLEDVEFFMKSDGNTFRSTETTVGAAAFEHTNGTNYFGFEDRKKGDFDYNDMVISMKTIPGTHQTPEPATFAMLGGAMALLGIRRFAQRRS